jgi:hypothetical protein
MVAIRHGVIALVAAGALVLGALVGERFAARSFARQLSRMERDVDATHAAVAARDASGLAPACPPVACGASEVDYDRIARIVSGAVRIPDAAPAGSSVSAPQGEPSPPSEAARNGIADGSRMLDRAAQTGRWTDTDAAAFRTALGKIDDDGERDALTQRLVVLVNGGTVRPTVRRRPL